jgi:hypothetical protein
MRQVCLGDQGQGCQRSVENLFITDNPTEEQLQEKRFENPWIFGISNEESHRFLPEKEWNKWHNKDGKNSIAKAEAQLVEIEREKAAAAAKRAAAAEAEEKKSESVFLYI